MAFTDIALTLVSPPIAAARRRKLGGERRRIARARTAFFTLARGHQQLSPEQFQLIEQYFSDYDRNRKDPVVGEELEIAQDLTARLRSGSLRRESLNPAQRAIIERYEDLVLDRQRRDDGDMRLDDGDVTGRRGKTDDGDGPGQGRLDDGDRTVSGLGNVYNLRGLGNVYDLRGLGETPAEEVANAQTDANYAMLGWAVTVGGAAGGAYHGYKRNRSVGWAIWWGLMGALFPIFTIPIAIAQGFGKRG